MHLGSYMPPLTLRGQQMGGLELDINQGNRDRARGVGGVRPGLPPAGLHRPGRRPRRGPVRLLRGHRLLPPGRPGPASGWCAPAACPPSTTRARQHPGEQGRLLVDLQPVPQGLQAQVGPLAGARALRRRRGLALGAPPAPGLRRAVPQAHGGHALRRPARVAYRNAYGERRRAHRRPPPRRPPAAARPAPGVAQVAFCQADAFGRVEGRPTGRAGRCWRSPACPRSGSTAATPWTRCGCRRRSTWRRSATAG